MEHLPVVLSNSYTRRDITRRLTILRQYLEAIHFSGNKAKPGDILSSITQEESDRDAVLAWKFGSTGDFGRTHMYKTLEAIRKAIEALPTVLLYLAYLPDEKSLTELGRWVRKNVGDTTLLDIRFDAGAVGGARIAYEGKFGDYSLHRTFEQHRADIDSVLRRFLKT